MIARGREMPSGPGRAAAVASESLEAFLAAVGSASPAPGGGAAGAFGGALAAALLAMVGRVTAEREPAASNEMRAIIARADALRQRLTGLVTDDMEAYRGVIEARRSGGGPGAVERALTRATEVPLMLAGACRDVLALCETVASQARASTLSDLGVAAALAESALEAGALIARANLREAADAEFARVAEAELAAALAAGGEARRRASEIITSRTSRRD